MLRDDGNSATAGLGGGFLDPQLFLMGFFSYNRAFCVSTGCDWNCYLHRYPDLARHFGTNLVAAAAHYERHGRAEGRDCKCWSLLNPEHRYDFGRRDGAVHAIAKWGWATVANKALKAHEHHAAPLPLCTGLNKVLGELRIAQY